MVTVRVVTWNVRSLRDDARGVARVLREQKADLVFVQEAPRLWRWRSACARLARESGLIVITGGRPAAGNLLLCSMRVAVISAEPVRLPKHPRLHRRGAVRAVVEVAGHRLSLLGTHLDLDPAARLDTVHRLRTEAYDVIGADVNEEPGQPAWSALSEQMVDVGQGLGPTFSVASPRRRLDALFVRPGVAVEHVEVVDPGPVTDHRLVLADLRLGPARE